MYLPEGFHPFSHADGVAGGPLPTSRAPSERRQNWGRQHPQPGSRRPCPPVSAIPCASSLSPLGRPAWAGTSRGVSNERAGLAGLRRRVACPDPGDRGGTARQSHLSRRAGMALGPQGQPVGRDRRGQGRHVVRPRGGRRRRAGRSGGAREGVQPDRCPRLDGRPDRDGQDVRGQRAATKLWRPGKLSVCATTPRQAISPC